MKLKDYLKQRRHLFFILFLAILFCVLILWANENSFSPAVFYMCEGLAGLVVAYIVVDYLLLRGRVKRIILFFRGGAATDESFSNPLDAIYAQQARQMADEFNQYKAKKHGQYSDELDFITRWVHDIKVPISALYLLTENLAEEDASKFEMQLAYIEQHTQKVLYHIKSNSFQDDFQVSKVDTMKIVTTALKAFATFFAYKKISLDLKPESFEVLTDEKWSGYIIAQFISNAVKHTPEGGQISIKTFQQTNKTIISVRNTGQGIEQGNLKYIFNKGYTSHSADRGSFSTGYGLYLSKRLAERMGHKVYALSKQNEYAQFCLSFSSTNDKLTEM